MASLITRLFFLAHCRGRVISAYSGLQRNSKSVLELGAYSPVLLRQWVRQQEFRCSCRRNEAELSSGAVIHNALFMVVLNRIWPVASRHTPNDLIGWQLSVLGTTYAVTLGFML
jgi:hypothetical protein